MVFGSEKNKTSATIMVGDEMLEKVDKLACHGCVFSADSNYTADKEIMCAENIVGKAP